MKKFVRTRGAPQPAPPALRPPNGLPNGVGVGVARDDQHSTLSRWGVERRGQGGALWEDESFPAAASTIGDRRLASRTLWLRPHELCARPRFLGDAGVDADLPADQLHPEPDEQAAARWCVEAGASGVGQPAVAAAAAALALTPRLLARAVPPQSFRAGYSGRFRFRFWVFGAWREVFVDDRLPTRGGRLLGSRPALRDDFTLPLLEKAYAKLYGGYAALRSDRGSTARALQELSGGVLQSFSPARQPRALLLRVLHSALPRSTLLVATVLPEKECGIGKRQRNGLVAGQAYCVTGLARVREPGEGEGEGGRAEPELDGDAAGGALVRLRAPSGRGVWSGAWARGSLQWHSLADPDRDVLETRAAEPGAFWMSFADFARSFARLELVHVGPDDWLSEPALHARRPWRAVLARRRWRCGYNAGGPPHCHRTAHANPQFHVQVPVVGSAVGSSSSCHVVVSVTQQYSPGARQPRLRSVGFAVYELPPGAPRRAALAATALHDLRALDVTHESRAREVVTFFTLPPGQYLVVPYLQRPHAEGAFLLRILTDEHTDVWEVNDDNVIVRDIAAEVAEEGCPLPEGLRKALTKTAVKMDTDEVDAAGLQTLLRRVWRRVLPGKPSRELCRALVAMRDPAICGRMPTGDLPPLLALLSFWKAALGRAARVTGGGCGAGVSAYGLRALLWACGVSASNKVLECLVLRFARGAAITPEACVVALARLHLAHERYRSLDTKMKSNPLSLEEMILMTIYS